jgi:hypothetical protein
LNRLTLLAGLFIGWGPTLDLPLLGQQPILLQCEELVESSGISVSPSDPNFIWTHNDSGSPPRLYLFNRNSGKLRGIFELRGASAVDWEDMASFTIGDKRFLAVGDIGDNRHRRSFVSIHVIQEPQWASIAETEFPAAARSASSAQVIRRLTIEVTYPTGPVDAEALVFDPEQSRFLLLTKELFRCRVFSVPVDSTIFDSIPLPQLHEPLKIEAEYVQTLRIPIVTAADLSPDGRVLAIGTYGPAYLLKREGAGWQERTMVRVPMPKRRQGEALAFLDSNQLLVTSEFAPTPLWTVSIPEPSIDRD